MVVTVMYQIFFTRSSFLCTSFLKPAVIAPLAARLKHVLPDLPYDYNALEPYISADIMKLHHQKHHATYVNNLNVAEEKVAEALAKSEHVTGSVNKTFC